MKYKAGDRVRIKSLDWYNENKDENGDIVVLSKVSHFSWCENVRTVFTKDMVKFCGKVVTIKKVWSVNYSIVEGTYRDGINVDYFTDEMIEGLAEEEAELLLGLVSTKKGQELIPHKDYEIKQNGEKFYLMKKKKEYPKTYKECCDVLDSCSYNVLLDRCETAYEEFLHNKLLALRKLIICRDAYWKIAGEEMGLGKPWEPIYQDDRQDKHCIYVNIWGITLYQDNIVQHVLTFPTEEMRDAFYENFKKLINECKELL